MDLRKARFVLPNLFTFASLFCGFYAIARSAEGGGDDAFYKAALAITYAMLFDIFDGRVARMTRTQTAIGIELDSLADLVSFGVAPAMLIYRWSLLDVGVAGLAVCFAYVAACTFRLARFNVIAWRETGEKGKPGKYIAGLPTPGAAGILVSLVVANHAARGNLTNEKVILTAVVLGLSMLMVSRVRFRSFKELKPNARTLSVFALAIGSSVFLAARYRPAYVLVWLLACYVAIGLLEAILQIPKRRRDPVEQPGP